ncbi:MAG: alpha/beta hydrolase [Alphaproteobacteria bacterium]|nr:alpha/beta hydrolase [Alphaproteobacteria bacterium]
MNKAPYLHDLAEGPEMAAAYWTKTADGITIRVGVWPDGDAGTVFIFPGRTEYVEKYGRIAHELNRRGYAALAIDWRGQGLADRLLENSNIGHVEAFTDYQQDVAAALGVAARLDLPTPWYMMAHSMGGAIGLRALAGGAPLIAAAFAAPMFGILFSPKMRAVVRPLTHVSHHLGFGTRIAPTTSMVPYLLSAEFEGNALTTDRDMWEYMVRQTREQKLFGLGGPSMNWLREAIADGHDLARIDLPSIPVMAAIGNDDKIVDMNAVRALMDRWEGSEFYIFAGAEHEILMDTPQRRGVFLDKATQLYAAAAEWAEAQA